MLPGVRKGVQVAAVTGGRPHRTGRDVPKTVILQGGGGGVHE